MSKEVLCLSIILSLKHCILFLSLLHDHTPESCLCCFVIPWHLFVDWTDQINLFGCSGNSQDCEFSTISTFEQNGCRNRINLNRRVFCIKSKRNWSILNRSWKCDILFPKCNGWSPGYSGKLTRPTSLLPHQITAKRDKVWLLLK